MIVIIMHRYKIYKLNDKKIIHLVNKYRTFIVYYCSYYEYKKFKDYLIEYYYDKIILKNIKYYNYSHYLHRTDGPALIEYSNNGRIFNKSYCLYSIEYSYEDYLIEINRLIQGI